MQTGIRKKIAAREAFAVTVKLLKHIWISLGCKTER